MANCLVPYRTSSSMLGFSSRGAGSTLSPPHIVTTKNVSDHGQMFPGAQKSPLMLNQSINKFIIEKIIFHNKKLSGNCVIHIFVNPFISGLIGDSWFSCIPCLQSVVTTSAISIIFWRNNMKKTQPHTTLWLEKGVFPKPSDNCGWSLILYQKSTRAGSSS